MIYADFVLISLDMQQHKIEGALHGGRQLSKKTSYAGFQRKCGRRLRARHRSWWGNCHWSVSCVLPETGEASLPESARIVAGGVGRRHDLCLLCGNLAKESSELY